MLLTIRSTFYLSQISHLTVTLPPLTLSSSCHHATRLCFQSTENTALWSRNWSGGGLLTFLSAFSHFGAFKLFTRGRLKASFQSALRHPQQSTPTKYWEHEVNPSCYANVCIKVYIDGPKGVGYWPSGKGNMIWDIVGKQENNKEISDRNVEIWKHGNTDGECIPSEMERSYMTTTSSFIVVSELGLLNNR